MAEEIAENAIEFKIIASENDPLFHKAYIACYEIFHGMIPYCYFRKYLVTVAESNNEFIGFMILNTKENEDDEEYDMAEESNEDYQINIAIQNEINDNKIKNEENEYDIVDDIIDNSSDDNDDENDDNNSNSTVLVSKSTGSSISTNADNIVTIGSIGIIESMRGKGIGDKYIKWLKHEFPDKQFELHVSIANTNAIKLYNKNGFKITNLRTKYYCDEGFEPYTGKGIDAYIMTYSDEVSTN